MSEEPTGIDWADVLRRQEATARSMRAALERLREAMEDLPTISVPRGGLRWGVDRGGMQYPRPDPRQGEEVEVYHLKPGARVYVLEDVFTVDRVDMHPIPTVWLKELPTSPLYFTEDEYICLANETED